MTKKSFSGLAGVIFLGSALCPVIASGESSSKADFGQFPQYREFVERRDGSRFLAACYPVLFEEMEGILGAGQVAREAGGATPLRPEQRTEALNLIAAVTELTCACWGAEFSKGAIRGSQLLDGVTQRLAATQNFEVALAGLPPAALFQFGMAADQCGKQLATVEGEAKNRINAGNLAPAADSPASTPIATTGSTESAGLARQEEGIPGDSATPKPSFDCAKAGNDTEREICRSVELSDLDRQLSSLYRCTSAATASEEQKAYLRSGQLTWMRMRNACGADSACVASNYENRIEEIATSRLALENCISE